MPIPITTLRLCQSDDAECEKIDTKIKRILPDEKGYIHKVETIDQKVRNNLAPDLDMKQRRYAVTIRHPGYASHLFEGLEVMYDTNDDPTGIKKMAAYREMEVLVINKKKELVTKYQADIVIDEIKEYAFYAYKGPDFQVNVEQFGKGQHAIFKATLSVPFNGENCVLSRSMAVGASGYLRAVTNLRAGLNKHDLREKLKTMFGREKAEKNGAEEEGSPK